MGFNDKRMDDALRVIISKKRENGKWVCESVPNLLSTFDRKGKESKWVTLKALTILRRLLNERKDIL